MSIRTVLVVVLALVFGGSAAVGINSFRPRGPQAVKAETVPVVMAAAEIDRGQTITANMLKTEDWPKDRVPDGTFSKVEDLADRVPQTVLIKGMPVLNPQLTPPGSGRGMGALTRHGMRAFTIPTPNIASGVAGFILPGDRVDVLLTISDSGTTGPHGGGTTTTLLQHVEILAVDQRVEAPADNKVPVKELRSVTLQVTPYEATQLALGQNKGTLQLSLRNPRDHKAADSRPATLASLRLTQQKPWDVRAKGLFQEMGKALAKMPAPKEEKAQKPKEKPRPEAVAPLTIRVLQGHVENQVKVTPPRRSAGDER